MGRPPVPQHLKRDKRLVVMLTDDEMTRLSAAAQAAGQPTLSDWIRETLMKAAARAVSGEKRKG